MKQDLIIGFKNSDSSLLENIKKLPSDHKWLGILLLKHLKNGWVYKYRYGNKILDKPLEFAYDEERGGIGIKKPDEVLIYKEVKEGYLTRKKRIGRIDFRSSVDPDFDQSLNILNLLEMM